MGYTVHGQCAVRRGKGRLCLPLNDRGELQGGGAHSNRYDFLIYLTRGVFGEPTTGKALRFENPESSY